MFSRRTICQLGFLAPFVMLLQACTTTDLTRSNLTVESGWLPWQERQRCIVKRPPCCQGSKLLWAALA